MPLRLGQEVQGLSRRIAGDIDAPIMRDFSEDLADLRRRRTEAKQYLRIDELRRRLPQVEVELSRPDLWDDPANAQAIQREFNDIGDDLAAYDRLDREISDLETLHEMARELDDESQEDEIDAGINAVSSEFDGIELRSLFTGEYDDRDAICEVNSGAGGVDAQDWAEMMVRMYLRWAERTGFEVELDEVTEGTEAGISSATFIVKGRNAYGWMRSEHGVHRLVRISPFDNNARRQTSFASMRVTPFVEDVTNEVDIEEKDLRIDVYRASGAGGQHINKTSSAVRITHIPTGIVVACQNERSQHQNKDRAMQILQARLLELARRERNAAINEIAGDTVAVDFGSQDRNYVLHPYQQVKDLRTGYESSNPDAVLDGELDALMESWLRMRRANSAS
jgi:peptide chain release factor 2